MTALRSALAEWLHRAAYALVPAPTGDELRAALEQIAGAPTEALPVPPQDIGTEWRWPSPVDRESYNAMLAYSWYLATTSKPVILC